MPIAYILLAIYLILVGLTILFGLSLPAWISGVLALLAGVMLLAARFGVRVDRKSD